MSDGKIDEAISNENGDKEDEALNNSVSDDGEIFDDDEPEENEKVPIIDLPRKNVKNFRSRQENSDSEGARSDGGTEKSKGITDGELRKLSRMNGVQMLDKNVLENYRDKIINELEKKNDRPKERTETDRRNFDLNSRFNASRNGFRGNRGQNKRNDWRNNRASFLERNRLNRPRENVMARPATADEFRVVGIKKPLYFPINIIKHTKSKPSIAYSERPQTKSNIRDRSTSRISKAKNSEESKKEKDEKKSPRKSEITDKEKVSPKKSVKSSQVTPKKTPTKVHKQVKEKDQEKKPKEIENEKQKSSPDQKTQDNDPEATKTPESSEKHAKSPDKSIKTPEKHAKSPEKSVKTPEKLLKTPEKLLETPEKIIKSPASVNSPGKTQKSPEKSVKTPEKIKVELKLEKKKSPRRIERSKVNIFLEDSDEVDEFESSMMEVRSKWSSPVHIPEEILPKMVSPPILETFLNVPMVESPEKSPLSLVPLTDNLFALPKFALMERSPTPSPPPKPTKVRNVCSFLSDIASGNMFAGLGLGSGLYDDSSRIDGLNLNEYRDVDVLKSEAKSKVEDEAMEPDTTVIKSNFVGSITPSDHDSDSSDESESESSSSSDSDDTTSESDESSDDSTDDDIPRFSGFGRFDASSMPMVTQIKPTVNLPTPSRFQPHQSVIKPPELITNVTKPAFYTPQSATATPMPFSVGLGTMSFPIPIPFKIYSLRDATNCQIIFPSPVQVPAVPAIATPISDKKDHDREKDRKDSEKDRKDRDRKRSRSRSRSHDRERKRLKDDRRKTPPRNRARLNDDRKDSRRKDPSPRHNSHSSRTSHVSRQSPTRRAKRSRSRTPPRHRLSPRPRTPPRQKSPPIKARRSSPQQRIGSRSPKHRRSLSPVGRRMRSPSPVSRRSPRRRQSRSPRNRRGLSPDYRYEHRSVSPSFNKTDSPHGYRMDQIRPDSTISDTELERQQQQFMQEEFYLSKWNNSQPSSSPKRPNLDDRIHRMLSDSPTRQASHEYPPDAYPYPYHDNRNGMFYQEMYPPGNHQMLPPHHDNYDYPDEFSSPRNFVNNSNLVDITQQNRDRQRAGNSQAVQVGNVLEIVPSNKIINPQESLKDQPNKSKPLSPGELKQQADKRVQTKLKRKNNRERKRSDKQIRKEKLRLEIQRYFDAGVTVDVSDDENLIPLRVVNIAATVERSILRKSKAPSTREKKVLFSDGILPGETTSDDEMIEVNVESLVMKRRRKKYRKTRLAKVVKSFDMSEVKESETTLNDKETDSAPPPPVPIDKPPAHLKQPQLKKITVEMFAAFPVNPDPLYYIIHKVQQAKSMYQAQQPPRPNDRFHYYKTQPPVVNQSPSYPQPPRSLNNSVSSLDPRIRSAEKSFT